MTSLAGLNSALVLLGDHCGPEPLIPSIPSVPNTPEGSTETDRIPAAPHAGAEGE